MTHVFKSLFGSNHSEHSRRSTKNISNAVDFHCMVFLLKFIHDNEIEMRHAFVFTLANHSILNKCCFLWTKLTLNTQYRRVDAKVDARHESDFLIKRSITSQRLHKLTARQRILESVFILWSSIFNTIYQ